MMQEEIVSVKKSVFTMFVLSLLLLLCACGADNTEEPTSDDSAASVTQIEAEDTVTTVAVAEEPTLPVEQFEDVVLYEDGNFAIKLETMYQKEINHSDIGKKIESHITMRLTNKTDRDIIISSNGFYLHDEKLRNVQCGGSDKVLAGKSNTITYYMQYDTSPDPTPLESMELLKELEWIFEFNIMDAAGDKITSSVDAEIRIADALNPQAAGYDFFYGTWEVTSIDLPNSGMMTVAQMEDGLVFDWSDWTVVLTENKELYLQTNNLSLYESVVNVTADGFSAGRNTWTRSGDKLVYNLSGTDVYYEKVSDDQTIPTLQKDDIVKMLQGTWNIVSDSRTGSVVFDDKSVTFDINTFAFTDTYCILSDEQTIRMDTQISNQNISIELSYTYENGELSLVYSGDPLVKE